MFTTVQPIHMKRLSALLKDVICESTLLFKSDGVHIQELDVTQELYIQVHLQSKEFEVYKPHDPPIRINLLQFHSNFGSVSKQDVLHVTIDDNTLTQKMATQVRSRSHILQTIPITNGIDFGQDSQWDVRFSMPCVTFHNIIKELCNGSSYINIELEKNKVTFSNQSTIITHVIEATSSNHAKFVSPIMRKFLNIKDTTNDGPVVYKGMFLSANFQKVQRASHLGPSIEIQLCNDCPAILKYQIGTLGHLVIGIKSM